MNNFLQRRLGFLSLHAALVMAVATVTASSIGTSYAGELDESYLQPPTNSVPATLSSATNFGEKLQISIRRVKAGSSTSGYANRQAATFIVATVKVPVQALQLGWRCCWVEGYGKEVARQLSTQFGRAVLGNTEDLIFDAFATEAAIRQIAPGVYEMPLAIGSRRRSGNQLARLYVHLYRSFAAGENFGEGHRDHQFMQFFSQRDRAARYFLDEPVISVSVPIGTPSQRVPNNEVPSQLPNR
jgi:hypothetical protein